MILLLEWMIFSFKHIISKNQLINQIKLLIKLQAEEWIYQKKYQKKFKKINSLKCKDTTFLLQKWRSYKHQKNIGKDKKTKPYNK